MNIQNKYIYTNDAKSTSDPVRLGRLRSEGVLTKHEIDWYRINGIELAYDPVQIGWVPLICKDDVATTHQRPAQQLFRFRPWTVQDAPVYARMLSPERLWRYLPEEYPGVLSEDDAAQLIELAKEDHHHVLAVVKGDVIVGQVRLLQKGPDHAEVSYWLGQQYWGKGYASIIVRQFCDQCMRQNPSNTRLLAVVHKDNIASQSVLRKCAFAEVSCEAGWVTFERTRHST